MVRSKSKAPRSFKNEEHRDIDRQRSPEMTTTPTLDEEHAAPTAGDAADAADAASDEFFVEPPTGVDGTDQEEESAPRPPKTMKDHSRREYTFVLITGLALAFSAGYTNGVCLSGFIHPNDRDVRSSVAGVTGLYTGSAINLGEGDWDKLALAAGTIFSVMAGSCISGLLNPYAIAFSVGPRYGPTFIVASIFMTMGAVAALHNSRREFYFTAMANGIQNGISSMYSANLIRTTHLTGTTTDIGLFIGMAVRGNRSNNWKLYILMGLATAFWIGSLVGFYASRAKRQYSLIFNAGFLFAIGASVIIYFVKVHSISFCQAIFGLKLSEWNQHIDIRRKTDGEKIAEDELMDIFDEIDDDDTGHIPQDKLLEALASNDLSIRRRRKDLIGLLHSVVMTHDDDGDWTLSKDDWRKLVHERSQSALLVDGRGGDRLGEISNTATSLPPSAYSAMGGGGGPAALRSMSIAQVRSRPGRSAGANRSSVHF